MAMGKGIIPAAVLITMALGTLASPAGVHRALAQSCEPVQECGDVNDTGSVSTTDALVVLKKAVGQPVSLTCECTQGSDTCESDLSTALAKLSTCENDLAACERQPVCGDGVASGDEECDAGDLKGETCEGLGFAGGTPNCAFCKVDTDGCYEARFDASGATIVDHETGLEWEKKTTSPGSGSSEDPHDVDNVYTWTGADSTPSGTVFTSFLASLNAPDGPGTLSDTGPTDTGCYAGHCDWRLPTVEELLTIAVSCGSPPCVADDVFLPAQIDRSWSASTYLHGPSLAWYVNFTGGFSGATNKTNSYHVRAVRGGS